jgi:hypothetical protein
VTPYNERGLLYRVMARHMKANLWLAESQNCEGRLVLMHGRELQRKARGAAKGLTTYRNINLTPVTYYSVITVKRVHCFVDAVTWSFSYSMATIASDTRAAIEPQPSIFRWIIGFLMVGACWGLTTPFMRSAAMYDPLSAMPHPDSPL